MPFWDELSNPQNPSADTPQSSGGFWDSVAQTTKPAEAPAPKATPTPPPVATPAAVKTPYFSAVDKSGNSFGFSDQVDPSGKPLFAYRNPGDTATTTDRTRVATTFDPRVAAPQSRESFLTPRAVADRADLKKSMGGTYSDELDHKIALELSGSNLKDNLQIEPGLKGGQASKDDVLETQLAKKVAAGNMSLFQAQRALAKAKGMTAPFTGEPKQPGFWDKVGNYFNNPQTIGGIIKNTIQGVSKAANDVFNGPAQTQATTTPPTNDELLSIDKAAHHETPTVASPADVQKINASTAKLSEGPTQSLGQKILKAPGAFFESVLPGVKPEEVVNPDTGVQIKVPFMNRVIQMDPTVGSLLKPLIEAPEYITTSMQGKETDQTDSLHPQVETYLDIKNKTYDNLINAGYTPTQAQISSSIFAVSDALLKISIVAGPADNLLKKSAETILKGAAPDVERDIAWQAMGRPPTKAESSVTARQLQKIYHPDVPGTGDARISAQINHYNDILQTKGIPTTADKINKIMRSAARAGQSNLDNLSEAVKEPPTPYVAPTKRLPGYVEENPKAIPVGMSVKKVEPVGFPEKAPVYQGEKDLTINTLEKLKGRSTVSKQFISDLTNSPDLKQAERDTVRSVLASYPENKPIPVQEFANKVKTGLLPLTRKLAGNSVGGGSRYEGINLSEKERGNVANYSEHIYNSPIKNSAGDIHFSGSTSKENYFAHTRTEDMSSLPVGSTSAVNNFSGVRRVIELQSDLFQKGNLEREKDQFSVLRGDENRKGVGEDELQRRLAKRLPEMAKLEPYRNTWQERIIKEEVKQAALDGKTILQFPTGETAMKIEGVGNTSVWRIPGAGEITNPNALHVGQTLEQRFNNDPRQSEAWVVTDVLGDGKFKAVIKKTYDDAQKSMQDHEKTKEEFYKFGSTKEQAIQKIKEALGAYKETFDISGKLDTNNPIYKFYEKEVGRYLKNKYGASIVKDKQGVSWFEMKVPKEAGEKPVTAFKKGSVSNLRKAAAEVGMPFDLTKEEAEQKFRQLFNEKEVSFFQRSGKLIKEGQEVWGAFTPGTVFRNPMVEMLMSDGLVQSSTLYHEAGHVFFKEFTTPAERKALLANVRNQLLTLPSRLSYLSEGYRGSDILTEEYIMDDFARYVKDNAKAKIKANIPFYRKIIQKIREWIRKATGLKKYYDSILSKERAYRRPVERRLNIESSFKKGDIPDEPPPKDKLDQLMTERAILEESIAQNPAKALAKFANAQGEIPEALGGTGGIFKKGGDSISTELGFKDSEEARTAYQTYKQQQQQLKDIKKTIRDVQKNLHATALKEKDMKSLRALLDRSAVKTEKEIARIASASNKPKQTEQEIRARKEAARQRLQEITGAIYNTLPPLEQQTPLFQAEALLQAHTIDLAEHEQLLSETPFHQIVIDAQTPVKAKVGILDYLKTPDRVLKKMGLNNTSLELRRAYDNYLSELPSHIELINEWRMRAGSQAANVRIFRYLDGQYLRDYHAGRIIKDPLGAEDLRIAGEIKAYLQEWANRLGLPPDNKISHYITHIFNIGELQKEFDEDVAKILHAQVPGSVYDPFLEKRLGRKGYIEDTWKALEAYVKRGVRKANMDPVLEQLKDLAPHMELSQSKYLERLAKRINMQPTEIDNLLDNTIKQMIGYRFGQRPTAFLSRAGRRLVYRAMLGFNLSAAVKNLTQGVNTYAKLGERYTLIGYTQLVTRFNDQELIDSNILKQDMIQDKQETAVHRIAQTADKALFAMFELAEKINRGAAYFGAKQKALDFGFGEMEAIQYAKKMVRDTQFNFSSIDTPVGLNSDVAKVVSQFMTYGVKQVEFMSDVVKNREWAGMLRYIVGSFLAVFALGKTFNIKFSDFVPGWSFTKFGVPPLLAMPVAILSAAVSAPDAFGNPRTPTKKLMDILSATPLPATVQIQRSLRGINAINDPKKGYEKTPANYVKGALLGTNILSKNIDRVQPVYDHVQKLINEDKPEEAQALIDNLTPADLKIYKNILQTEKTKATKAREAAMQTFFEHIQQLVNDDKTDQAAEEVQALSPEDLKAYKLILKKQ